MAERKRGKRKVFVGTVISDKMDKTVVVAVERRVRHPLYKKVVRKTTKCYAHDENNACRIGDIVEIMETRPLSKLKRWRVVRILRHAHAPIGVAREGAPEEVEGEVVSSAAVAPAEAGGEASAGAQGITTKEGQSATEEAGQDGDDGPGEN